MEKIQSVMLRSGADLEQQQRALAQCLSKFATLVASGLEDVFNPCYSEIHFFYLSVIADGVREIQALYFPLLECCWPPQTLPYMNEKAFVINPDLTSQQRLSELTKRIYQVESLTKIANEELFVDNYSDDQINFLGILYELVMKIRQLHEALAHGYMADEYFKVLATEHIASN